MSILVILALNTNAQEQLQQLKLNTLTVEEINPSTFDKIIQEQRAKSHISVSGNW
ncbi:hypothetical protein [Sphingobacterium micropteri]|nr:hypothetical protein [Sphingobacterium micropteri]